VGFGKLDGDQTAQGNTGFTQIQPPCKGKDLRPACLTFIDEVAYSGRIQWRRRCNLAKRWRALEITSAQVGGGEK
jgi:hypothetical protein